jgi:hypothetical protein
MEKTIKVLVLTNNQILISQIEEVGADLGEPDCKLVKPFEVKTDIAENVFLIPWNSDYTSQDTFMVSSEKILTIVDPKPTLLEKYQLIIK